MTDQQLDLIRQYCDTTGTHLSKEDKELLCTVLENPELYDGYVSQVYTEDNSGKDYNGRWESSSSHQYRINIDSDLSLDYRYKHECDDGYLNDTQWNNPRHITEIREIIKMLRKINDCDTAFLTPEVSKENGVFDIIPEKTEELRTDEEDDEALISCDMHSDDNDSNGSEEKNNLGMDRGKVILCLAGLAVMIGLIISAPKIKDGWNKKVKPWLRKKGDKLAGKTEQSPEAEEQNDSGTDHEPNKT